MQKQAPPSHQIIQHPHEGFELLLPDLPLRMRARPVSSRLWVMRTHFILRRVQHHQIVRTTCTRQGADLKEKPTFKASVIKKNSFWKLTGL